MKALVIYDSAYGNTEKIAQTIAQSLLEVEVVRVGDATLGQLDGIETLVVGSPTQGFTMTKPTRSFLKSIPAGGLKGIRVAAFDTRFTEAKIKEIGWFLASMVSVFGYAAKPIGAQLEKKGGVLAAPPEAFFVDDSEGPLVDGELERAREWARGLSQVG